MKFQWPVKFGKTAIDTVIETKASAVGSLIARHNLGIPTWSKRDYANFAREAYQRNAIAFRCVKLIAGSASRVPLILVDKSGKKIDNHPILDLLYRPNPMNSGIALFEAFYAYLLLSGNTYLEAVGPDNKPPMELWTHRPERMSVIAGSNGLPSAYEYTVMGIKHRFDVDFVTGKSPILHMLEFHPTDDWYGLSRVEPSGYGIDRHNAASAHNKALLDNQATPSGALVFESVKKPDGTVAVPPQEVIDEAAQQLEGHMGTANAGKAFVLGGNVEWMPMGLSPKDMDYGEGKDDAGRDICTGFGVPHVLVIKGSATYNNVKEAKVELFEDTIVPLVELGAGELSNWLVPMFGDDLRLVVDRDAISALEARREAKRKSTAQLLKDGVITAEEAREDLQYEPFGADVVRKVDGTLLKSLIEGVDVMGFEPLIRYAKSVGLYNPNMTEDALTKLLLAQVDEEEDENGLLPNDNDET